jgi:AhpD family alkylhydroperoxidase
VPSVPLLPLAPENVAALDRFAAPESSHDSNLYRALANDADLLTGWIELAWRLRDEQRHTPTRLRELMIVRAVQLGDCGYELAGHSRRALAAGITETELADLAQWREGDWLSAQERVALAVVEEVVAGRLSDPTLDLARETFSPAAFVEVVLTAGFYSMTPRVIDALRLNP